MAAHKRRHALENDFDIYGDIAKIKAAFSDTARDLKGKTSEAVGSSIKNARLKSDELTEKAKDYVSDRPIKSLGLAMISGVLLGYLMHGKRNHARRHR